LLPDFLADYFSNVSTPPVSFTCEPDDRLDHGDLSFRHENANDYFLAFMGITSNTVGSDGISIICLRVLLPFTLVQILYVFNHAIISSVFPST
jgi:hypothetical protein